MIMLIITNVSSVTLFLRFSHPLIYHIASYLYKFFTDHTLLLVIFIFVVSQ